MSFTLWQATFAVFLRAYSSLSGSCSSGLSHQHNHYFFLTTPAIVHCVRRPISCSRSSILTYLKRNRISSTDRFTRSTVFNFVIALLRCRQKMIIVTPFFMSTLRCSLLNGSPGNGFVTSVVLLVGLGGQFHSCADYSGFPSHELLTRAALLHTFAAHRRRCSHFKNAHFRRCLSKLHHAHFHSR